MRTNRLKNRLFDHIPKAAESLTDSEPLFSSFAKDQKFRPPVSSKEVLQRKLLSKQQSHTSGQDRKQSILKANETS